MHIKFSPNICVWNAQCKEIIVMTNNNCLVFYSTLSKWVNCVIAFQICDNNEDIERRHFYNIIRNTDTSVQDKSFIADFSIAVEVTIVIG